MIESIIAPHSTPVARPTEEENIEAITKRGGRKKREEEWLCAADIRKGCWVFGGATLLVSANARFRFRGLAYAASRAHGEALTRLAVSPPQIPPFSAHESVRRLQHRRWYERR